MVLVLKVVAVWGLADSLWMALDPAGWAGFWGRFIRKIGEGGIRARLMAATECAFCLYLLGRGGRM